MDYYSDSGHLYAKIFHSYELPEFAKQAECASEDTLHGLPDSAFALPGCRAFPIYDRSNTIVSAAYAFAQPNDKTAQLAIEPIRKAASVFGIADEIEKMERHVAGLLTAENQKQAADATPKPFEVEFGPFQKLAGSTDKALEQAIEHFFAHRFEIGFADRAKAASVLMDAAAERGIRPPQELARYAGRGCECNVPKLNSALSGRATMMVDGDKRKLAFMLAEGSDLSSAEGRQAMASKLAQFDEEEGLGRFYYDRVLDPHLSVFNEAADTQKNAILTVGVSSYPHGQWIGSAARPFREGLEAALGSEKAALMFGIDGAPLQEKLAELSPEEVELVNRYLEA